MRRDLNRAVVCVVGLGYVGMPLARAFARSLKVIGFDKDAKKIRQLTLKGDNARLTFTTDSRKIRKADFIIICVPTLLTPSKEPDLSHVREAAGIAGRYLKRGAVVVLESSVYPGVTEEVVKPILESESGLSCGLDFKIGHSPERVNPGDDEHDVGKITKVVAGMDEETSKVLAALYNRVTPRIFVARDIRTAEAAKLIENIQRDLNIALMNELSIIFARMGLRTRDILDAAATKWNFHQYHPGLVGGYCIPVNPYYLVYKARQLDFHPQVILAGRATNDSMPRHIAGLTIKALNDAGKVIKGSRVLIMGLTYKENVSDSRESPVKDMIKELKEFGVEVYGYDPVVEGTGDGIAIKMVADLKKLSRVDAVIVTVPHGQFKAMKLSDLKRVMSKKPVLVDVRQVFDGAEAEGEGFYYRTL